MKLLLAIAALLTGCSAAPNLPDGIPAGFSLQEEHDFETAASLSAWAFSDPQAWRWNLAGVLELTGASEYAPPYRSPRSIALLDTAAYGDFVLEAELVQTGRDYGHRDLCLFFGFGGPARYYYVHLATTPDERAHNVFVVNQEARRALLPVLERGVEWGRDERHRVRLERIGDRIRVFFDDFERPIMSVEDSTHGPGRIGFGSFDDQGLFDNVRIWAARSMPLEGVPFASAGS